jgi:outer membrane protein OmpA-like peptidoglycan-associated protein
MDKMNVIFPVALLISSSSLLPGQDSYQYADTIIDSYYSNANKDFESFYGGSGEWSVKIEYKSIEKVLGNNKEFISLPKESYVIVGFTNTYITDALNQNDIFIEEAGNAEEYANISVSYDNKEYAFLGKASGGVRNEFDLHDISFTSPVRYIKIVGEDNKGGSPGFDLISVSALPGASVKSSVTLTKDIPDMGKSSNDYSIHFDTNESLLDRIHYQRLNSFKDSLSQNHNYRLIINGHTDDVGTTAMNLELSKQRMNSTYHYLVKIGANPLQLETNYFGETAPISTNGTVKGRALNRRVELHLVTTTE